MSSDSVRPGLVEAVSQLRSDLGDEIALELCTLFLKNTPDLVGAMRTGLASDDARGVGRAAHELKSTAAALGAHELALACADLEALATSAATAALDPLVDAAARAFEDVRDGLAALVAELRVGT